MGLGAAGTAAVTAAGIGAAGSIGSGLISSGAAKSAGSQQQSAANSAAELQMQMFQQMQQNLQPWISSGQGANQLLSGLLGIPGFNAPGQPSGPAMPGATPGTPAEPPSQDQIARAVTGAGWYQDESGNWFDKSGSAQPNPLLPGAALPQGLGLQGTPATPGTPGGGTSVPLNWNGLGFGGLDAPFQPTMTQLAQTPGYQFTLGQGLQAVQNSAAAQGLGSSGSALKGAANYAEGLASTTFQQQFQNYWAQNQAIFNMLGGVSGSGQSAAANLGSSGLTAATTAGQFGTAGAAAGAAGTVGAANAISGAIGGVGQNALLGAVLSGSGMFSGGATAAADNSIGGVLNPLPA